MNATSSSRFNGTLKKWNAERGFGFVAAEHGDQDLFVHVSAFARDGRHAVVGEPLSFEIELGKDGRKRAVRVQRPGTLSGSSTRSHERTNERTYHRSGRNRVRPSSSSSVFGTLIVAVAIAGLGWFAYGQYREHIAARVMATNPSPVAPSTARSPAAPRFQCDGRQHCSQMSSCQEAKLFLRNCPDMKMDGDNDGIPCEDQLCRVGF